MISVCCKDMLLPLLHLICCDQTCCRLLWCGDFGTDSDAAHQANQSNIFKLHTFQSLAHESRESGIFEDYHVES